jgi:lysophospholipase L1-like esterase
MRRSSVVAVFAAVLATGFAVVSPAAAEGDKPVDMVALGDSYGSGTGAGDYEPGTENVCWRSRNALPEVVAAGLRARGKTVNLTNVTCSGATTASLRETFKGQPPQLSALRKDTTLVTLSIGTSDVDFAGYGGLCIQGDCSGPATDALIAKLPGMRQNVERLIAEIKKLSPRARIMLTGYGSQLTSGPNAPDVPLDPICADGIFTPQERVDGNRVARLLDLNLRRAAYGSYSLFVSPYINSQRLNPAFVGHSLCEAGAPYYRGFDALAPGQEGPDAVLHLNKPGHAALAAIALRAVS